MPECDKLSNPFKEKGFLAKSSESNTPKRYGFNWFPAHHWVVLLPSRYKDRPKRVHIQTPDGVRMKLKWTGYPDENHDPFTKERRHHFRLPKTTRDIPRNSVLKIRIKPRGGKKKWHCWIIQNPNQRIEGR